MMSTRGALRNVLQELQQLARRSTVQTSCNFRSTCSPSSIIPATQRLAFAVPSRSYATDAAEDAAGETDTPKKSRGRPKGATISAGAKPKKTSTKKTTTPRKKKEVSPEEKTKLKVSELKKLALAEEPKNLPYSGWTVFLVESKVDPTKTKEMSEKYKELSESEKEHYQNIAKANAAANKEAYKAWVESHTVEEIQAANRARKHLRAIAKQPLPEGRTKPVVPGTYSSLQSIPDKRIPKRATPFSAFVREQWATGKFSGVRGSDAMKIIASEFKNLSTEEKQALKAKSAEIGLGGVTADI